MTWMSVDLIIRRWHWPKERLQSYRLLCKPAAVQVQSQQELWIIWVVQRFIRLLYLKRLLKSIMSEFYLWRMLYPVFACSRPQCFFFGKLACACEKTKKIGLFFHWLQIVLTIEKKRLYNLVFKIKVRSLINLMIILLGTNVSYWQNSHVFLDRSS